MYHIDLPDEVREFKKFVETKQGLANDVRRGKYTWQELYDRWHHHRDQDPLWDEYETISQSKENTTPTSGTFTNIIDKVSNIDFEQLEKQVHSLSKTIDQVQGFIKKQGHQKSYKHYNQRKRFF